MIRFSEQTVTSFLLRWAGCFTGLFILSVSFPYSFLPDVGHYLSPYFEPIIKWVGDNLFHIKRHYTVQIISDSTGMYIHCFDIGICSMVPSLVWTWSNKPYIPSEKLTYGLHTFISHYLALQLLIYGLNKVFKYQFYLPEPNTLYTPLGYLSRDILYWSTIGTSYSYSMFTGLTEVIPALLLLFRKTRLLGGIIALGVTIHVVMINFSFDISVKVYSCFLLLLSGIISLPALIKAYDLFIRNQTVKIQLWTPHYHSSKQILGYALTKSVVVAVILYESLFIYFETQNFNDDLAPRPFLHGVYEVDIFIQDNDTIPALLSNNHRWKRFFIHRKGYFITQTMNDKMIDYNLKINSNEECLILTDAKNHSDMKLFYRLNENDSSLILSGSINKADLKIRAVKKGWSRLPALQPSFHWTIDDYSSGLIKERKRGNLLESFPVIVVG